jgi:DNA-binding LacI/PurR family transcriptional regulator
MPRVTRRDVARKAGVSTATVSYVINNGPRPVAQETRHRVLQAIKDLDYQPNQLARGLTTGRTQALGVVIPDVTDPFFPELILGAEKVARERGYSMFLCNANREPELELHYVDLLTQRQTDGLLMAGSRLKEDDLRRVSERLKVVILTPFAVPGAITFALDDFGGGYQTGEYLISLGHSEIRFIEGAWRGSTHNRYRGLVTVMEEAGLSADNVLFRTVQPSVRTGHAAALRLFAEDPKATAVVCYNDLLAIGVLQAAVEVGKRVPEELSIVGFDDIPEVTRFHPYLTTVHVDRFELGKAMMSELIDVIGGGKTEADGSMNTHQMIPVSLVKRETCCSPMLA